MSVQHWWNDTGGEKLKYMETNLTQCYFDHHRPLMDWLGIEPRILQ
jgi:hypothetical protein